MRFSTLLKHPADWMTGAAAGTSVVLTSRVRLARNLRREPFPGWSTKERRVAVLERVKPEVEALPEMKNGFSHTNSIDHLYSFTGFRRVHSPPLMTMVRKHDKIFKATASLNNEGSSRICFNSTHSSCIK